MDIHRILEGYLNYISEQSAKIRPKVESVPKHLYFKIILMTVTAPVKNEKVDGGEQLIML